MASLPECRQSQFQSTPDLVNRENDSAFIECLNH